MSHLSFDPYIPLALWAPLALAAAGLLAAYAFASRGRLLGRRRAAILALMTVAAAVPLAVLLNPTWMDKAPPPPGKPLLSVLVDASQSMEVRDAPQGRTRYDEACRIAKDIVKELGDRYEIRLRSFAAESWPTGIEALMAKKPDGTATDLAAAVKSALDSENPQGQAVLLLSDGGQNVGGTAQLRDTAARAKSQATPIFTHVIGGPYKVPDLEVSVEKPQELAFVRQQTPVVVTLEQKASLAATATLHLLREGKEIEKRTARLIPDGKTEQVFNVKEDAAGLFRYEVIADTLPGEVIAANNSSTMLLRVVDQPLRVLLLEGKPYWETKFLIRSLAADESIELTAVVQLAEGRLLVRKIARKQKTADDQWTIEKDGGKFLADRATLAAQQIVILGRNAEVFLNDEAVARLTKWLDDDGSLVCFRGAPESKINQRLDTLMPVSWTASAETRFRAQWTDEGQKLRWLPDEGESDPLAAMPALASDAQPTAKRFAATVLATNTAGGSRSTPVVCRSRARRVVVVEGAGMWRWAFMPPQHQDRDELYGSLWRSLVRWLATDVGLLPSQRLALRAEKSTFNTEENAVVTLQVREDKWTGGTPRVELPGSATAPPQTVDCKPMGNLPGQYQADLGRLPEGRYRVRVAGAAKDESSAEAAFDVRGNLKERLDVKARPEEMAWIAQTSGGAVLERADPRELAQKFDEHIQRSRPERIFRTAAWDRWWLLLGAFGLWAATWGIRRWSGLV
jgi:hypothetical protein